MKIINTIKIIKEIHSKTIVLVRMGKFYNVYGKDAYILSYLFSYKLKEVNGYYSCGFPISALNKIIYTLEDKQVNYIIVSRRENYQVEEEENFKSNNKYEKIFDEAYKVINIRNRIKIISEKLLNNTEVEKTQKILMKIEEVLYEI